MSAIEKILASRPTIVLQHEVVKDAQGNRTYRRLERGVWRELRVWSWEHCRERITTAGRRGRVEQEFMQLAATHNQYCQMPGMMHQEWFSECFARCEKIYYELLGDLEELEEFGA